MLNEVLPSNISATKVVEVDEALNKQRSIDDLHTNYRSLRRKLLERKAKIGVLGLGYVGLPLSMVFAEGKFTVIGFDKSPEKVKSIVEGVSYIQDVETSQLKKHVDERRFTAYSEVEGLGDCDVVILCVPTPLAKTKDPDMSYILSALDDVEKHLRRGQLVILESTTYPGTTKEVLLSRLEQARGTDHKIGRDFFLAFSPERVDPGNEKFNTYNTPKIVGGVTEACGELASILYSQVMEKVVRVSSPESAEMVKLLENTFRAVNIGLVNEIAIMCEKLDVDVWEVIEAAATKPFGYMPFYPGPGLGGHCIPIDPSYLSWKLRSLNYTAKFIELANSINTSMPEHCVSKAAEILNEDSKAIKGSKILLLGIAYKKDIDDLRESPALDIIHHLKDRGAEIEYYDPYCPRLNYNNLDLKSIEWSPEKLADYDLCIVTTDHSGIDYAKVIEKSRRIFDTRNALSDFKSEKITKL